MKNCSIAEKAEYIANKLIEKGVIIHRYDAYSTNSIYLKLDYGVCNSIRISDHNGKEHLSYRYNIGKDIKNCYTREKEYKRFYYPFRMQDEMIQQILCDRQEKIDRYGTGKYIEYMGKNKEESINKKGFWQGCKQLN